MEEDLVGFSMLSMLTFYFCAVSVGSICVCVVPLAVRYLWRVSCNVECALI